MPNSVDIFGNEIERRIISGCRVQTEPQWLDFLEVATVLHQCYILNCIAHCLFQVIFILFYFTPLDRFSCVLIDKFLSCF